MEKGLNIAAILKEKPENIKLYSTLYGDVYFKKVCDYCDNQILVGHHGSEAYFKKDGRIHKDGEVCLFPSKEMRDWEKFAWKKGDVLKSSGSMIIFDKWHHDDYSGFSGAHHLVRNIYDNYKCLNLTDEFEKASKEEAKEYVERVEKLMGGKLNLSTLQIEHPKQEFKDGDILVAESRFKYIFIYKEKNRFNDNPTAFYVSFNDSCLSYNNRIAEDEDLGIYEKSLRLATDSEKQQLYDALAKESKRWNPDTKQVEDLPKKCEFKAFQKVLTRDTLDEKWIPNLFSNYNREHSDYMYGCIAGGVYSKYCIPYNDQTKHLLGTTDEWKGGER